MFDYYIYCQNRLKITRPFSFAQGTKHLNTHLIYKYMLRRGYGAVLRQGFLMSSAAIQCLVIKCNLVIEVNGLFLFSIYRKRDVEKKKWVSPGSNFNWLLLWRPSASFQLWPIFSPKALIIYFYHKHKLQSHSKMMLVFFSFNFFVFSSFCGLSASNFMFRAVTL